MPKRFLCRYRSLSIPLIILTLWSSHALGYPFSGQETGLRIPRFVSLAADRANVRVGPGLDYPIEWTFVRGGLPLEIMREFGNWRRIRDWTGDIGWIHHALLSGERTAIVAPWGSKRLTSLFPQKGTSSPPLAVIEPLVVVKVRGCDGRWCSLAVQDVTGFVPQRTLWGVYPGEILSN